MKKNEYHEFYDYISEFDTVSIDIFDTLILRNVMKPTDIFNVIENKTGIKDFASLRISAEKKARKGAENGEVNIYDIYEHLDIVNKDLILETEIETELKFCVANPFWKKLLPMLQDKKIILISDMYLPENIISRILEKNNLMCTDEIYVSCDYGLSKHQGTLFEYIYELKQYSKEKWVHIGDNTHSDVFMPEKFGINALEYKKVSKYSPYSDSKTVSTSIIKAIQINKFYNGLETGTYFNKIGQMILSPLHFSLANWLFDQIENNEKVYFCSRDGYIPHKIFDLINEKNQAKNVQSQYFYTSRRAYQAPISGLEDKNFFLKSITGETLFKNEKKVSEAFSVLNLKQEDYEESLKKFGFSSFDDIITNDNRKKLVEFINAIYIDVEANFKEEKELVEEYLNQIGMTKEKNINIFDIGWRGSTQLSIQRILNRKINGFFLGVTNAVYPELNDSVKGYAFEFALPRKRFMDIFDNIMMYELFFSAPQDTLLKFVKNQDRIEPVFAQDQTTEQNQYLEEMVCGVIEASKDYLEYIEYFDCVDIDEILEITENFISEHSYEDMIMFQQFKTNVAIDNTSTCFVQEFSKEYILKNKKEFLSKIENSLWRNSFVISDVDSKEDFDQFCKKNLPKNFAQRKGKNTPKLFTFKNAVRGIRHPSKVIKVLKRMIKA